jgi:hypothetical protein
MSALRRHIFGLFAACAALAAGIALGAGPLQGEADAGSTDAPSTGALQDQVASLRAQQVFGESVLRSSRHDLLGSALAGASVTLVVLPGVREASVSGVEAAVVKAGGQVNVTVLVSSKLVDPAQKTYASSVATSSVKGLRDLRVPSDQPYAQLGALIGRAYMGRGTDLALDDEAVKIDSELRGARLVSLRGSLHRRASLVVVLGSGEHGRDPVTLASHVIEVQLLSALAAGADAVLLAAPATASQSGGLLDAVRRVTSLRQARLSTLNVVDGPAAQISAVYALAAAAHGSTGAFGVAGTTVTLPPGL